MKSGIILCIAISAWAISACSNSSNLESDSKRLDSLLLNDTIKEQFQEFVHIFPSQIKVGRLFKNAGLKFQATELVPAAGVEKLVSPGDKALAMGFYGVDMVYASLHNQTQIVMSNLRLTKKLSEDLGLESVYAEKDYVRKFEANINNQDTLESIIRDLFAETDAFLQDNKKLDLYILSFAGGWTESVYLAANFAYSTKNKGVVQLIGEQLISLDPLIELFRESKLESKDKELLKELEAIRASIRAGIVKEETDTEPMLVEMDDEKLKNLISSLQVVRNRIIQPKP